MRRALLLLLFLLPPLAPPALAQDPSLLVEYLGDDPVRLDTAHLSARLRFRVTNVGDAPDYVTIPRQDIRWTDTRQTALGFPSPEFGLPLAPGAAGEMWAHVDVGEPRVGARAVEVTFKSEHTGRTTSASVAIEVAAAAQPSLRLVVRTEPAGARVEVTDLTATSLPEVRGAQDPGGWSAQVPPGRYAIRADAPGRQGATRIVTLPTDGLDVHLALGPARWNATASQTTSASVGDSAWLIAGSRDLSRLVTAPMVHQQPQTAGKFVGLDDGEIVWDVGFPGVMFPQAEAGPFQALDTVAAVSADGALAAGFDWNGRVHVVDARDGRALWTTDRAQDRNAFYPATSAFGQGFFTSGALAFSPDGGTLVAGGSNGWLVALSARNGTLLWTRPYGAEIRALRFTPDGSGVFVGSGDWHFHRVDAATGAPAWSADDPEFWPFFFLATSGDGALVAAGGKDAVYRVWNATDGTLLRAFDVFPAFVTGGGIGAWGGTFSDWVYGVRGFDADGNVSWFRRFKGANVATTDDGRFSLVGWATEGGADSGLALLDETGTTLWSSAPGLNAACTSTASPFPAKQIKSVLLAQETPGALRFAAACIGGGVFTGRFDVSALDAPAPPTGPTVVATTPAPATSLPPPVLTPPGPSPPSAPTPALPATSPAVPTPTATPAALVAALAALALAASARRRR